MPDFTTIGNAQIDSDNFFIEGDYGPTNTGELVIKMYKCVDGAWVEKTLHPIFTFVTRPDGSFYYYCQLTAGDYASLTDGTWKITITYNGGTPKNLFFTFSSNEAHISSTDIVCGGMEG